MARPNHRSWYNPPPANLPERYPGKGPKTAVPSYIGDPDIVLNLLMYRAAGDVAKDYGIHGNHGEIHGARWTDKYSASWALVFDGSDDYVIIPNIDLGSTVDWTVISWFKTTAEKNQRILGRWDGTEDIFLIGTTDAGDGQVRFGHFTAGEILADNVGPYVADGDWHSYIPSWDSSENAFIFYVDGSEVYSETAAIDDFADPEAPDIGRRSDGVQYWNGVIGWILVYRGRALSGDEIKAHQNAMEPLYAG